MATESVTNSLPGIRDVLIDSHNLALPNHVVMAAANVSETVLSGIAAIGDLLWHASTNKESVIDPDILADTGCLLKELAMLASAVQRLESNAAHLSREAS